MTERQEGILWRIARLHPGWICVLIVASLALPALVGVHLSDLPRLTTPLAGLIILAATHLCVLLPFLYVFGVIVLLSGRFHSRVPRRLAGPSAALAILAASILGFFPFLAAIDATDKNGGFGLILFFLIMVVGDTIIFIQLLVIASKELIRAEQGYSRRLREVLTCVSLFFWPLGFFWIQARVRRLVKEFDTGVFSRLPMEAVRFSDYGEDRIILLTRRVRPLHAATYAEEFVRRGGGSIRSRRQSARSMSWEITINDTPLRLVFDNDPPKFTLHADCDPADEALFKVLQRVEEGG